MTYQVKTTSSREVLHDDPESIPSDKGTIVFRNIRRRDRREMCDLSLDFGNIIIRRLEICYQPQLMRSYSPIILMATISLVTLWEAFHTVPKEPVPSFSSNVYATEGSALDVDSFILKEW